MAFNSVCTFCVSCDQDLGPTSQDGTLGACRKDLFEKWRLLITINWISLTKEMSLSLLSPHPHPLPLPLPTILRPPAPTPSSILHLPARDWTRDNQSINNFIWVSKLPAGHKHREPTLDILTKKWSETVENSTRYDCLVLGPARQRREIDEGVGGGRPTPRLASFAPTRPTSHLPARDWTRDNRISSSFWSFQTIFSLEYPVHKWPTNWGHSYLIEFLVVSLEYSVWAPCAWNSYLHASRAHAFVLSDTVVYCVTYHVILFTACSVKLLFTSTLTGIDNKVQFTKEMDMEGLVW